MVFKNGKGKTDTAGQENAGDDHLINCLRKIIDTGCSRTVKFLDKSELMVDKLTALGMLELYNNLRTTIDKERMFNFIHASAKSFERMCLII